MSLLEHINEPADLAGLTYPEMQELAEEIRQFLIHSVSQTGGHLGPNLGVVELTLAIHRVFTSPQDAIIFDTGHQSYVHKIITGRRERFNTLRQAGGLSGYPSRSESCHDWVESSHASASLSYADGLVKSFAIDGIRRNIVVVVGDGALTGGMTWEALNNIAEHKHASLTIVVNDNGRSYAPTIGGLAERLTRLRTENAYEWAMYQTKKKLKERGKFGQFVYSLLHGFKTGIKDTVVPEPLYSDLGLKYIGPVDGHNQRAIETALKRARDFDGPVIVHAVTRKGEGYPFAEHDKRDRMHTTEAIDPETGISLVPHRPGWTEVFSEEMLRLGAERPDIVAITAAMAGPVGLVPFRDKYPDRFFDVGIAEQHAIASAAGLALGGKHPVVALYATFLNRAFDQLLMDVALIHQPVTVVLDRAGVTGPDGASHDGMWDLSLMSVIPTMRVAAPRDPRTLREEINEAVAIDDGPTVVRYPKGPVTDDLTVIRRTEDGVDILFEEGKDVLIVGVGTFARRAVTAAQKLVQENIGVTVVDPRWVLPLPEYLLQESGKYRLVVVYEDNAVNGGIGSVMSTALHRRECDVPLRQLALPQEFLPVGTRKDLLKNYGLDSSSAAHRIKEWFQKISG